MSKKYRIKGTTRRKIMQIELKKEMRALTKKTKPSREISEEHKAFQQIDEVATND